MIQKIRSLFQLNVQKQNFSNIKHLKDKMQQLNLDYSKPIQEFMQLKNSNKYNDINNLSKKDLIYYQQAEEEFLKTIQQYNLKNYNAQSNQQYKKSYLNNPLIRIVRSLIIFGSIYYLFDLYQNLNSSDNNSQSSSQSSLIQTLLGKSDDIEMQKNIKTRFSDVLGIDEFKDELLDLVDYLKEPEKYLECGAKLPKGILLSGPPGTGKTLLARALAGEAGCSFFYKSGSEFDEMFVGVGASRVRQLFKKARENSPSIIFIDEIDSLAGKRNFQDSRHARDTINQILTEMDGFKESENVIVIGATNFEKALDPAIMRPGRFDKTIHIPFPDVKGRQQIFDYYLKTIKTLLIDSNSLARQTTGFTGADIQNMVNVAILQAIRTGKDYASQIDFEYAKDRIRMGIGRVNLQVSDKDKLITAYHEGGHALTSVLTVGSTPLHKVTILPRGSALGFTSMVPGQDQQVSQTKRNFISQIDVAMGGRAAEELLMGDKEVSSGCSSDLQQATQIAYQFVMQFGMNEDFSLIALSEKGQASDKYQFIIDQEVQKMLKESYNRVKLLLTQNYSALQQIATELIQKETLLAEEVIKMAIK